MGEDRREIMMPVAQSDAMGQFFIQAMKENTGELRELRADMKDERRENTKALAELRADMKEDRKTLIGVRDSVIKIEGNRIDSRVTILEAAVAILNKDKDHRDGASGAWNWLLKNLPTIAAIIIATFTAVVLTLKATGKL